MISHYYISQMDNRRIKKEAKLYFFDRLNVRFTGAQGERPVRPL